MLYYSQQLKAEIIADYINLQKGLKMNEFPQDGKAVDPELVPTSPTPAPAEVAKEAAHQADEAPAK